mmetsp:Transcript_117694/g.379839  ORF Transcript_117694/g.379839 Transcript_117694/m.379839 type:complete len:177 (-) Transcript_117694:58-588(-)
MARPASFIAALLALLSSCCVADILASQPHVQTAGVFTCLELGGTCRVPGESGDDAGCEAGEEVKEFEIRCDSGCGYWHGQCGQTCCVPVHRHDRAEEQVPAHSTVVGSSAGQENVGVALLQKAAAPLDAGGVSAGWVDAACLAGITLVVFALYRHTCTKEKRPAGSLLEHDSDIVE